MVINISKCKCFLKLISEELNISQGNTKEEITVRPIEISIF
jgi:hypothetical protein